MAYSELVKNFNKIRDYMREFYVYGFKSRDEFTKKSARSYDDERRRMESWLGDYMRFRQTPDGKNVFISIDSRDSRHNPLYKAWKAKSFTDGDITLHFILFDILSSPEYSFTLSEITDRIDSYLCRFDEPKMFDESTVRKKLKEYAAEGLVVKEKNGKKVAYRRAAETEVFDADILDFFSEVSPCGVIGSYLLDKISSNNNFAFKHHYITNAMDSEIVCQLFDAMRKKRMITIETISRQKDSAYEINLVPLRIMLSTQGGRQYLMAYTPRFKRITSFRTDNILSVKSDGVCERFDELRVALDDMQPHMWGVSTQSIFSQQLEHVEFTVRYDNDEKHIHRRLEREKRCGTVEAIDDNTSRFSADIFDSGEIVPWMRTFICRIISFSFSNKVLEERFRSDIEDMYNLYEIEDGESE